MASEDVTRPLAGSASHPTGGTPHPEVLGRYILLHQLGEGGMSVVYAAYDPELDRKIALKLLSSQRSTTSDPEAWLLREAQSLARLSHPNVVQVYDVGTLGHDVFIAMELVAGKTLRAWLTERPRSWRERLRIAIDSGAGLAAAHRAGLVHHDFKPTNVIVGDDGRVRVVDFGLARPPAERSGDGEPARIMGTPGYIAPEHSDGDPCDARSDEFSFCVTLFEALYGTRPFGGASAGEEQDDVRRGRPRDPPPNSGVPPAVQRAVLRGLARDPRDRFPDMDTLLDVLRPHVSPTRRWRLPAAIVGVALLVTAVAVGAAVGGEPTCRGFDTALARVWGLTQREQLSDALAGQGHSERARGRVLEQLDAYGHRWVEAERDACEATHLRQEQSAEALDRRTACLRRALVELDALVSALGDPVVAAPRDPFTAVSGLSPLGRCADPTLLSGRMPSPDAGAVEEVEAARAALAQGRGIRLAGGYTRAHELVEDALAVAERHAYRPLRAEGLLDLAILLDAEGSYADAVDRLREAMWLAEEIHGDALATEAAARLVYAVAYRLGDPVAAVTEARHAEALAARMRPDAYVEGLLNDSLGVLAYLQADYDAAADRFERALSSWRHVRGEHHPSVADALNNLGGVENARGRYDEALRDHQQALDLRRELLGGEHRAVAMSMDNLGNVLQNLGRWQEALEMERGALAILEAALGPDHPELATVQMNLGNSLRGLDRPAQARSHYERALQLQKRADTPDGMPVAAVLVNLGRVLTDLGDHVAARAALEEALRIAETLLGADHPVCAYALTGLGVLDNALGDHASARDRLERAERLRRDTPVPPGDLAEMQFELARALWPDPSARVRARELAATARERYAAGRRDDLAAEVGRWLSER